MMMLWLRLYLLAGLVLHKGVWEVLKQRTRGTGAAAPRQNATIVRILKAVKIALLAGLVAQTVLPEVLPITEDPRVLRMVGAVLYTLGLCIAVAGRLQLGDNWTDIETPQVSGRQAVVAVGLYRYVRHPIYVGDLLLVTGFELALNSWLVVGVVGLIPYVVRQAMHEEEMLAARLPGYGSYCSQTWRFVPFVV